MNLILKQMLKRRACLKPRKSEGMIGGVTTFFNLLVQWEVRYIPMIAQEVVRMWRVKRDHVEIAVGNREAL